MFVIVPEVAIKSTFITLFSWGAAFSFSLLVNSNDDYLIQKNDIFTYWKNGQNYPKLVICMARICMFYVCRLINFVCNLLSSIWNIGNWKGLVSQYLNMVSKGKKKRRLISHILTQAWTSMHIESIWSKLVIITDEQKEIWFGNANYPSLC